MSTLNNSIVAINAGSSSIKLAVLSTDQDMLRTPHLLDIAISNIGEPVSLLQISQATKLVRTEKVSATSHVIASGILMEQLDRLVAPGSIVAIGHRVVHGGFTHAGPTLVENISETDWELIVRLDPEHAPVIRQLITQFARRYPSIPQVACFDTAFFHDLPQIAKIVPIPQEYYDTGVRRYGFHGLSYMSLLALFCEEAGVTAMNGRIVLAHLGSGASLAATRFGKPIDTTMGFTPASGIVMSTRSGDLDPGIFRFLNQQNNMSIDEFNHMVNFESGLLGVSNLSGDMKALLAVEDEDKDAATAIELFVSDVKKSIGALATTLGGIDSLIFSGGIGEQSAVIRARICQDLGYIGIEINQTENEQNAFLISAEHTKVGVHVIPSDEALIIATQTRDILNGISES